MSTKESGSFRFKGRIEGIVIVLSALLIVVTLSKIEFFSRGEGREALNAQGVLWGNWLLVRGYGGAIASKPPLLHWLIATASLPFGIVTELSARIPSFVAAVWAVWFFVKSVPESRRLAVFLVLASAFEWVRASLSCRVDMVHAATLAVALMMWPAFHRKRSVSSLLWGGGLVAASTLTKGPVALVLPAIVFVLWFLISEREQGGTLRDFMFRSFIWFGVAGGIASLWYFAAIFSGGGAFTDTVWRENIERFAGSADSVPHQHGMVYLGGTLLAGLLPWTILVPLASVPWVKAGVEELRGWFAAKSRGRGIRCYCRQLAEAVKSRFVGLPPIDQYALLVGLVVLFFYSVPGSKRGVYLLVGYPFYAILLGRIVEWLCARGRSVVFEKFLSGVLLGLAIIVIVGSILSFVLLNLAGALPFIPLVGAGSAVGMSPWLRRGLSLMIEMGIGADPLLGILPLLLGLAIGFWTWRIARRSEVLRRSPSPEGGREGDITSVVREVTCEPVIVYQRGLARCLMCSVAIILIIQANIQIPISRLWSERLIAEGIKAVVPPDAPLVSWHREFYGASLYARRTIGIAEPLPRQGEFCLLRAADLEELRNRLPPPLQPVSLTQIIRGFGGRDTVLIVKIQSPGAGLGAV